MLSKKTVGRRDNRGHVRAVGLTGAVAFLHETGNHTKPSLDFNDFYRFGQVVSGAGLKCSVNMFPIAHDGVHDDRGFVVRAKRSDSAGQFDAVHFRHLNVENKTVYRRRHIRHHFQSRSAGGGGDHVSKTKLAQDIQEYREEIRIIVYYQDLHLRAS
jgi:hypothetical protein